MLTTYLLFLLLFFLPLLFPPVFSDWYDAPKILFFYFISFLVIIISALKFYAKPSFSLPGKKITKILLGFFLIYFASAFFSLNPLTSLIGLWDHHSSTYTGGLIYLVVLGLLFLITLQISNNKFIKQLNLYLTVSALLVSLYGLFEYFSKIKIYPHYRIRSSIGEPNRLAFFLVSILPLSLALFLKQKKFLFKILSFLSLVIIFTAILLTLSRGAWLTLIMLIIINLAVNIKKLKIFFKKNYPYLFIFSICLLIFLYPQKNLFIKRALNSFNDLKQKKGSTYLRLLEWQAGFKVFQNQSWARKIIGTGPETIKFTYPKFRPVKINEFNPDKNWQTLVLRNQYLHYLNTIGILGLFLYFCFIILVTKNYLMCLSKNIWQSGFFYAWLTIVLGSIFYYQTLVIYPLFWIFSAVILGFGKLDKIKLKKPFLLKTGLILFLVFSGLGLSAVLIASQSLLYAKKGNFEKAVKLTPFFDFLLRKHSTVLQQKAMRENNKQTINKAIINAQKAYQFNSLDINNLKVYHAALYKASGYLGLDKKYQKKALDLALKWSLLDPSNPSAFDSLGLSLLDLGRLEQAKFNFEKAVYLDNDYLVSYLHLGEVYKQKGEIKKAIEYYELALQKKPNWPFAQEELQKALLLLDK